MVKINDSSSYSSETYAKFVVTNGCSVSFHINHMAPFKHQIEKKNSEFFQIERHFDRNILEDWSVVCSLRLRWLYF